MIKRLEKKSQVLFGLNPLEVSLGECKLEVKNALRIEDKITEEIMDLIFFDSENVTLLIKKLQEIKKGLVSEEIRIKKESKKIKKKEEPKND